MDMEIKTVRRGSMIYGYQQKYIFLDIHYTINALRESSQGIGKTGRYNLIR